MKKSTKEETKKMNREERQKLYSGILYEAITKAIHDEEIKELSMEELKNSENLTDFIFVISSMVPTVFYSMLTGDKVDMIGMNHIANRLTLQNLLEDQREGKLKVEERFSNEDRNKI